MARRKLPDLVLAVVVIASLLFGPSGVAAAAIPDPGPTGSTIGRDVMPQEELSAAPAPPDPMEKYRRKYEKWLEKQEKRVTQEERKAAADRSAAKGFELPAMGTAEAAAAAALPGQAPHYFSHPNYANSPLPVVTAGTCSVTTTQACMVDADCPAAETCTGASITGGIQKFVDPLPWGPTGDPLPIAADQAPAGAAYDYYEIGLVQYRQQFHSDLPAQGSLLRGYVQLTNCANAGAVPLSNAMLDGTEVATGYCGVSAPSYLGPAIVAQKDMAVRILFRNLLPAGQGGDLFIPTDVSVMGAGMGPDLHGMPEVDPQNPACGETPKPAGCFTENRADLHLHGGLTPWISDGTPHQWITPADETLPYPDADLLTNPNAPDHGNAVENKGVSVEYVPDMWFINGVIQPNCTGQLSCAGATNNPGPGAQTYYYTNQQSARLRFYHDHAWGITRLNVYAGEAAPYLIQDAVENTLTGGGALNGLGIGIPLVVQDKTFVPSPAQIEVSDSTWDYARWGGEGNLWLPHVYSPAQNPGDSSGVNQFGRWAYGPWFWPPTQGIAYGPIPNPYAGQKADGTTPCDPNVEWCEPAEMPGTPWNSMGMEAFQDTPVVNGKAYPTVTLDPQEYRFRFLNAANDRFFNLSLYQAVDANGLPCADPTGAGCTEAPLNPAEVAAALADPTVFPTPLAGTEGPAWIQIGNEAGFLPAPVVIPAQPITWVNDPTVFNAGNVDQHSLLLGPAETADVVVDLTPFAGKTLILYNDAPAAFPARDPRYDYYTGNGDYRDTGGAPSTLPGYGPNIRTVMQIVVTGAGGTADPNWVNPTRLSALQAAFAHNATSTGVFESSQNPIIVGQGAYNSAYGTNFVNSGALDGFARITDFSMTFRTLFNWASGNTMTMGFGTKAIQDEMGEAFDRDYGRMSGNLGLEVPLVGGPLQNLILYPYVNPASELINATSLPSSNVDVTPIQVNTDGTQIWKITHNGVDTHPIHFHLFDVQLLNRVGWDGIIRPPEANELGWKDTVRISPLEDTIVALRPVKPWTPFDSALPNSTRPLNPAMPTGSSLMFTNVDAQANPTAPIVNLWTNFGWEYVWHCHILSHEEMDMMRPISVSSPPAAPAITVWTRTGNNNNNRRDNLTWTSTAKNVTGFVIRRAPSASGPWTDVQTAPFPLAPTTLTYSYNPGTSSAVYYQVFAINTVGYGATAGYSTLTTQGGSNVVTLGTPVTTQPGAPNSLTATAQTGPQVRLSWTDTATNETGFIIRRQPVSPGPDGLFNTADDVFGALALLVTVGPRNNTGSVTYTDVTVVAGSAYRYTVSAVNSFAESASTQSNIVTVPAAPVAPTNVAVTAYRQGGNARVTMTWLDMSNNETGFEIQRATNSTFTAGLVTSTVGAGVQTWNSGNLSRSTNYYFRIRAVNAAGGSVWVNATPFPILTPP